MTPTDTERLVEPGIYIDLPEDVYHADPAIGGSSFKNWIDDPIEWWWQSAHNIFRPDPKSTDATEFGKCLHKIVLEGRNAFNALYSKSFDASAHIDALDTVDDYKAALRDMGERVGGNKDVLRDRLESNGFEGVFMEDLRAEFEDKHKDKIRISEAWYGRLALIMKVRECDPRLREIFSEGMPEVSVFWNEGPLRCCARYDWIKRGEIWDLKTYAGRTGKTNSERRIYNTISLRYDLQMAHYKRGHEVAKTQELPIYGGTQEQRDYIKACFADIADFNFLFLKTTGAPQFTELSANVLEQSARSDWQRGMGRLRQLHEHFGGVSEPWIAHSDKQQVEFIDIPAWFGMSGDMAA